MDEIEEKFEKRGALNGESEMTQAECRALYRARFKPNGGQGRPWDGKNHADPFNPPPTWRRSHRHIGNSRRDHHDE